MPSHFEDTDSTAVQKRTGSPEPKQSWRTNLIGHPLQTADAPHQTIGKLVGLAGFSPDDIPAVHVSMDEEDTHRMQKKWENWGEGYRQVNLDSLYHIFLGPLLQYIDELDASRKPNEVIPTVAPEFILKHWWTKALHAYKADTLRWSLSYRKDIVITDVPYQVN